MMFASGSADRVVAVILAAGASTRLGRPKQLVRWGDESLLERAARIAIEAGCTPLVVLGYAAKDIASGCDLSRCRVVINPSWAQGMGSSIRAGIEAVSLMSAQGALMMTCDQPAVTPEHLRRLVAVGAGLQIVASTYAQRKGVPAYIPASSFAALQALGGDSGARDLLQHSSSVDLPFGELDIDTDNELQRASQVLLCKTS